MSHDPLGFLKELAPSLYQILNSEQLKEPLIDSVRIEDGHKGLQKLIVQHGSTELSVHSAYPDKEADKILEKMQFHPHKLTVAWGTGLGYHIDCFLEKHPNQQLVILEPSYMVLQKAMRVRNFEKWFRNPNITFIITPNPEEMGQFICSQYNFHRHSGMQFLELPSYAKHFQSAFNTVKKIFIDNLSKFTANMATIMDADDDFLENCMRNVRHFSRFPWVSSLFGQFPGIPAIVISAGPSLHLQFEKLKDLNDKAVLIAVDTAYPILKKQGIEPHFVCTADPNSVNFIHLKGLDVSNTHLVVEPMSWHETLEMPSVKAFISNFDGYYSSYFAYFAPDPAKILSWGSIASTCFDVARKLNCNPITFVGQDLAYSDLLTHCPTSRFDERYQASIDAAPAMKRYTTYETYHMQMILTKPLIKAHDMYNSIVLTQQNLKLYAGWLEEQFKISTQTIINASERGILKNHCKIMSFDQVREQILTQKHPISEKINQLYLNKSPYLHKELLQDLEFKTTQLKSAQQFAKKMQKNCLDLIEQAKNQDTCKEEVLIKGRFSEMTSGANCGISDRIILGWMEHKNQKAEVFFQRSLGKLVGSSFSGELVQEMGELYYNYFESRHKAFTDLIRFLGIAIEGCWQALEES